MKVFVLVLLEAALATTSVALQGQLQVGSRGVLQAPATPAAAASGSNSLQAQALTVVRTAAELQAAIEGNAVHIEVQAHLDFRGYPTKRIPEMNGDPVILFAGPSVRTLRGNCAQDMPSHGSLNLTGAPLLAQKGRQCLLVFSDFALGFSSRTRARLWLDNLYMRHDTTQAVEVDSGLLAFRRHADAVVSVEDGPSAWLTNMTVQGNGLQRVNPVFGLFVAARVHAEDGVFAHLGLGSDNDALNWEVVDDILGFPPIAVSSTFSTLSFALCEFRDIYTPSSTVAGAGIEAPPSALRFEQCTFQNNSVLAPAGVVGGSSVLSDKGSVPEVFDAELQALRPSLPLASSAASSFTFLATDDVAFFQLQQEVVQAGGGNLESVEERLSAGSSQASRATATGSSDSISTSNLREHGGRGGGSGMRPAAVAAITAAAAVVSLLAVALITACRIRIRRQQAKRRRAVSFGDRHVPAGGAAVGSRWPEAAPEVGNVGPLLQPHIVPPQLQQSMK